MWTPDVRRLAGAAAGVATPGLLAAVAWWLGIEFVSGIATAGTPIGLVIGWWLGPRAATPRKTISSWLIAAISAVGVAIGAVVAYGIIELVTGGTGGPASAAAVVVYLLPLVIVYAFVFGLPVTTPVAAVWSILVRGMTIRPRLGWPVVGVMAVAAALLGIAALSLGPTLDARLGKDLRREGSSPIALALSRTEIRWTFRNCAPWSYAIAVASRPLLGGPLRAAWDVAPNTTTSGSTVVEPGWTLGVEPDAAAPLPLAYRGPKAVLDDVPGSVVDVELQVGPTGEWSHQVRVDGRRISTIVPQCPHPG